MSSRTWPLAVVGLAVAALVACESEEITFAEPPEVADTVDDVSDVDDDAEPQGYVGPACETDNDCGPGTCINETLLEGFGVDTTRMNAPNGMCSKLFCTTTEECGAGADCFDLEAAFGAPVALCLKLCDDIAACRWQEGYSCFQPVPDDEREVCLPDSIIVAIVCDDGHCDEEAP